MINIKTEAKVMAMKESLSQEENRRDSYKLLSECYYLPDEGLLKFLDNLDRSRGSIYLELAKNIPAPSDIESLRIDYSKLFVGPYTLLAPPYGSIYLENMRRVMGDSTVDVGHRYAEEGLRVDLKEAPDHIAIELEFMYFLISKEVEAVVDSDSTNTVGYLRKQKDFLETHLGVWVSDFTDKIKANAETIFYRNLAWLTNSFVKEELKNLSETPLLALHNTLPA
jgi:TorA maturation chaperone TorD